MKHRRALGGVVVWLLLVAATVNAQTFDLQFVPIVNDAVHFTVKVQIKSNVSTFNMGTGNFVFTYNASALSTPVLGTAYSYSGGLYTVITVTTVAAGKVSVNVEYNGGAGSGILVPATYTDVASVQFNTTNPAGNSNLVWNTIDPNATNLYSDDNATTVSIGTLNSLDTSPLPIQLSNFVATAPSKAAVTLSWTTLSETNNYGFYVQKGASATGTFARIAGSFIGGAGTTTAKHQYSYTDNAYTATESYYRLEQVDLDGTSHYSDPIQPSGVTGVSDKQLPTVFALDQNYPNPFNPTTIIQFALPKESRVAIVMYNVIGQKVATLVDDVRPAGYYTMSFNGAGYASGMYIYKMTAGKFTSIKKMMLVK